MKTKARAVAPPVRPQARPSGQWQARPRVSAPGDAAERDADRMADEALRRLPTPDPSATGIRPTATAAPLARRAADEEPTASEPAGEQELDDDDVEIPARARASTPPAAPPGFLADVRAGGSGRGLEPEVRGRMESSFGRSFADVRVHDDARSAGLADAIDARAFAHGDDIFFAGGEYAPGTPQGDHLLAHELSHTLQRRSDGTVHRKPKMTDEEKIERRIQFHAEAVRATQQALARFDQDPTVDAAKFSTRIDLLDEAITSAEKIADPRQKAVRLDYLRQERQLMGEPFYAQQITTGVIFFSGGDAGLRQLGNPAVTLPAEHLRIFETHAAVMRGGAGAYVTFINEVGIYHDHGIQPSDLQTAESSADEAGSPGLATPSPATTTVSGGTTTGGTIEDRMIAEMEAALEELGTSHGDTDRLGHELRKLDEAARRDFYQFVRRMHEKQEPSGSPVGKTVEQMLEMFHRLDPAEREALTLNRELAEKGAAATELDGQVLLNLKADAQEAQTVADNARRAATSLDLIRNSTLPPEVRTEMADADLDGVAAFLEETAMLQGLLAGGGSRSTLVKDVGHELIKEIAGFHEKLQRMLVELALETAAWAAVTAVTEGAAAIGLIRTLKKVKEVKRLVDTLRHTYDIAQRIKRVVDLVANAGDSYKRFRLWFDGASVRFQSAQAALESIDSSEDLEESIEAQEEKLIEELEKQLDAELGGKLGEILEMMYIPEDTPPEELRQILFDIPHGISALEEMWAFYLAGSGSPKFAEVLALKGFRAGRLLYPLVGLSAALVAEQLQAAFPERTVEDRINRLISRNKRGPGLGQRNRGLFGRLRRKDYEYKKEKLGPLLIKARDALRTAIDDDEPGSGNSEHWAPAWFTYTVRREIKEVNKRFRGETVEATRKQKKPGGGTTEVTETVPLPPFRVRVKRPGKGDRKLTADITINPALPLEVDRLTNDDFAPPGLEFAGTAPKRQDAIRKFLHDAGYELTTDPAGHEHIRLPGGKESLKNRPYLHIDGAGRIVAGLDPKGYEPFIGSVVHVSGQLPEGYHLVHRNDEDWVSLKGDLAPARHQKLGLDPHRKLIKGVGSAPPKQVATPGIDKPRPEDMEGFDHAAGLAAMFAPPVPGGPVYNLQGRSRALWQKTVNDEPDLQKRPKRAVGRLGYIVRARAGGDQLGRHHITEMHKDDDKGHLVARRFGGVDAYANLVPMLRKENQFPGKWFRFESDMAEVYVGRTAKPGHYVHFELSLIYPTNTTRRPSRFVAKFQERDAAGEDIGGAKHKTVDND